MQSHADKNYNNYALNSTIASSQKNSQDSIMHDMIFPKKSRLNGVPSYTIQTTVVWSFFLN